MGRKRTDKIKKLLKYCKDFSSILEDILDSSNSIRVIYHYDADGISSAALFYVFLQKTGYLRISRFTSVKQLYDSVLKTLKNSKEDTLVFLDLGSGYISKLESAFKEKKIVVIDHHKPEKSPEKIAELNCERFDISGDAECSASVLTYLTLKNIEDLGSTSVASIVGAFGDLPGITLDSPIIGPIIRELEKKKLLKRRLGLNIFGRTYKRIPSALAYTFDPFLPGISGDIRLAILFLKEFRRYDWIKKKISDIGLEGEQELLQDIIIYEFHRNVVIDPSSLLSDILQVPGKKGPCSEVRECAVLLNACGRMGEASTGMLILAEELDWKEGVRYLSEYRKYLLNILQKVLDRKGVEVHGKVVVLNGIGWIPDSIIGTVTSILCSTGEFGGDVYIGYATLDSSTVKVSVRTRRDDLSLAELVRKVAVQCGGRGGGHRKAAGAEIPLAQVPKFIKEMIREVEKRYGDERKSRKEAKEDMVEDICSRLF